MCVQNVYTYIDFHAQRASLFVVWCYALQEIILLLFLRVNPPVDWAKPRDVNFCAKKKNDHELFLAFTMDHALVLGKDAGTIL